jgi:hypothetical protein
MHSLPRVRQRRAWLGAFASLAALTIAVGAALATGTTVGQPTALVERLSGASTTFLDAVATALPVGYAFGAGMVAAVNPADSRSCLPISACTWAPATGRETGPRFAGR